MLTVGESYLIPKNIMDIFITAVHISKLFFIQFWQLILCNVWSAFKIARM